jgi:sialate O-acetylesterase
MNLRAITLLSLALVAWAFAPAASGELTAPAIFSDNMVLQRGVPVTVWGWANDGEKVTVRFRGKTVSATTKNLEWQVKLPVMKAGGPDTLTISTPTDTLQFTNALVGEVWVCSGQSNMEWPLNRTFEPQAAIASATNNQIRLFKIPKKRMASPTTLVDSSWSVLSPERAQDFSAVAYYFGRDLHKALGVPIGLIGTYWGGTPAEAWTSRAGLEIDRRHRQKTVDDPDTAHSNWVKAMHQFEQEREAAKKEGKSFDRRAPWEPWRGGELFNGMIAPLLPYNIKGAIWYQGENNAPNAARYRDIYPNMIRDWRRHWNDDFTFICVQLAPFKPIQAEPVESDWAELREAQLLATKILPKVGMAVITDVGDEKDIHPGKKEPVGQRLALAARAIAYGQKIEHSGPSYSGMKTENDKVILSFSNLGGGLVANEGPLKGFAVAGADRKFVWADAQITGDKVVVSSSKVSQPVAVRYGWADYPVVNLWNKAGLPASPFRTDDFPMITAGH